MVVFGELNDGKRGQRRMEMTPSRRKPRSCAEVFVRPTLMLRIQTYPKRLMKALGV